MGQSPMAASKVAWALPPFNNSRSCSRRGWSRDGLLIFCFDLVEALAAGFVRVFLVFVLPVFLAMMIPLYGGGGSIGKFEGRSAGLRVSSFGGFTFVDA